LGFKILGDGRWPPRFNEIFPAIITSYNFGSKTEQGRAINNVIFGQSIPKEFLPDNLDEFIFYPEIPENHSLIAKIILANEATKLCRGEIAAVSSMKTAQKTFEGGIGENLKQIPIVRDQLAAGIPAFKLFVDTGLSESGGQARKLISGKGARINDKIIDNEMQEINLSWANDGKIKLSAGKKNHAIIIIID
jgi:tyrosyl-tRNA synthetase